MGYKRIVISKTKEECDKDRAAGKLKGPGTGHIGFCGGCGKKVLIDKKFITELWQKSIIDNKFFKETGEKKETGDYIINVGFICPICTTNTKIQYVSSKSAVSLIENIGLYNC